MVNKDKSHVSGTVSMWLFGIDGKLKQFVQCENLVLPAGLTWIASRCIGGRSPESLDGIAVGTDNTAAASSDLALVAEIDREELIIDPWTGVGASSHIFYCRTAFDGTQAIGTIQEYGIYFGSQLFNRAVINPAVTKASGEILVVEAAIAQNDS